MHAHQGTCRHAHVRDSYARHADIRVEATNTRRGCMLTPQIHTHVRDSEECIKPRHTRQHCSCQKLFGVRRRKGEEEQVEVVI